MELDFTDLGWVGGVPSLNREIDWGWQLLPRMPDRIQFFCSFSCHNVCGKILTYKVTCENHLNTSNRHAATDDTDLLVVGQCQGPRSAATCRMSLFVFHYISMAFP